MKTMTPTHQPAFAERSSIAGFASAWRYDDRGWTRDLRVDFLRGFVFVLLFTVHFDYFSWFALIGWERWGVVSSAEIFIVLAGIVTGAVFGKKLKTDGLAECTLKLGKRAWTLYKIAVLVAGSIAVLRIFPGLDTSALTTFTDPVTGSIYPLYPPQSAGFLSNLLHVLVLAATPHQFQIVGLYAVLFLITPVIFWAISRGYTPWLIVASWLCYGYNYLAPESTPGAAAIRLTVGQFEYGFPTIAWQLLFVHGVVAGYYRRELLAFFSKPAGRLVSLFAIAASLLLMIFSLNHPLDVMPEWATMKWIPNDIFTWLYTAFFQKYKLGPGRVLNVFVLTISLLILLTYLWKPLNKAFGWLFIPLGQESMYVFFVHVYMILLVSNTSLPAQQNVWINTGIHLSMLLLSWVMIKTRFLFNWIPR